MKKTKENTKAFGWKPLLAYWFVFAASFLYWELLIKGITGAQAGGANIYFLCFIPAEALFMAFFAGWTAGRANVALLPALLLLDAAYYIAQTGYYRIFGSLFSVSMLGMGTDAVADFGWTAGTTLINSADVFCMALLPVEIAVILEIAGVFPREKYSVPLHLAVLPLAALAWLGGVALLMAGGTGRQSAYYAFFNPYSDTDSTSAKLGASATTLVEAGAYLFGIGASDKGGTLPDADNVELVLCLPEEDGIGLPKPQEPAEATGTGAGADVGTTGAGADAEMAVSVDAEAKDYTAVGNVADDAGTAQEDSASDVVAERRRHVYEAIDFAELAALADDTAIQSLCEYYAGKKGTSENDFTGMFEGYNLIYICAEAFSTYALDEQANPTLYKLANNGIVLDNYYNSFKNTTTNGEYAFATSLWPDVSRNAKNGRSVGSFPQSADNYMPYGLGNITAGLGYHAYGFHNYKGSYYCRNKSLPNLGLECKFMNAGMRFTAAWPSSDLEMMQQSVDDYINDDRFIAYYMTFSGHGPYDETNSICEQNRAEVAAATDGMGYTDEAVGYLAGNRELDLALEYLLGRLEEAGKLENTLIVLAGDHYPYYMSQQSLRSIAGHKVDMDFEIYHSTCILYNAGMEEPIHSDTYCCNVDILPTVLNLLAIPYDSRMIAGTDIFSDGSHKAVLYNKSFINDTVRYNAAKGKAEWLVDVSAYSDRTLEGYLDSVIARIDAEYAASLSMMDCDFYRFVWENAGLMEENVRE